MSVSVNRLKNKKMASPLMGPVKPIDAPLQQLAGSTRVATNVLNSGLRCLAVYL
jgi:hypothetical protein